MFGLHSVGGVNKDLLGYSGSQNFESSSLYDALALALNQLSVNNIGSENRKLWVVLFSEGFDNSSYHSKR